MGRLSERSLGAREGVLAAALLALRPPDLVDEIHQALTRELVRCRRWSRNDVSRATEWPTTVATHCDSSFVCWATPGGSTTSRTSLRFRLPLLTIFMPLAASTLVHEIIMVSHIGACG